MNRKLKVVGLVLLVVLAIVAFSGGSAMAQFGAHLVSEVDHTTVSGVESGEHRIHIRGASGQGPISCKSVNYTGTMTAATVESLTISASNAGCTTTESPTSIATTTNGCTHTFTYTKDAFEKLSPVPMHITCPAGKAIEMLTVDVDAKYSTQNHSGICVFLGTSSMGQMIGSITLKGTNTAGEPVSITVT